MKKDHLFYRRTNGAILFIIVLLFSSCIDGYEDDELWSSGVENITLESPNVEDVTITPSADGSTLNFQWPVVMGAGGYEFSLYIVDDPNNPVAVGEEKQIIDGTTVQREMKEDTLLQSDN